MLAEFERGATIVLQALHLNWPPLAAFSRALEAELGHPVQANAYFTPADSQGLPVHHDTHDVFVLQVSGRKRWLVYDPVLELPLRRQHYRPELGEPGDAVEDVVLDAGDTLYLPRGWLHQAVTSDTDSLHLTVGVNVQTWHDAFKAALESCADDVEFRRSLPAGGEGGEALLELLRERLRPDEVARRARDRLVRSRRPIRDRQLAQLRALDGLTLESEVERRPTILALVAERDGDGRVALEFEGKTLVFPEHVRADVEFLAAVDGPIRPADLPGALDDESRLVLVRRLVREGFLTIRGA